MSASDNDAAEGSAASDVTLAHMRALISRLSVDESARGMATMNLGWLLGAQWATSASEGRWQDAITELSNARSPVPPETNMLPLYDLAIGQLWYARADATGNPHDEAAAISALEVARRQVPEGSGVHCTASTLLGELRLRTTSRNGDPVVLERAVQDFAAVLIAEHARPPEKARSVAGLAHAMWLRYRRARDSDDLWLALKFALRAKEDADSALIDPGLVHALLGSLYGEVFYLQGDREDLDAAIAHYDQRLTMPTDDPGAEATAHNNASNAYGRRYEAGNDPADLERAIDESRIALGLVPSGAKERGRIWSNLSVSLLQEGLRLGRQAPLDDAVDAARAGLDDGFDAPDVRPRLLKQLAHALLARHALFGVPSDSVTVFDEATSLLEGALAGLLVGNATLPVHQRLTSRSLASAVQSLLIGVHLTRSRAAGDNAANHARGGGAQAGWYLSLAFVAAEASKAPLLAHEVLRRRLSPPQELREGSGTWEAQLLGEAAGLDLHELLDDTDDVALRMRRMHRRELVHRALESEWDSMGLSDSEAVRRYARLRRNDAIGLAEALHTRPAGCDLVSLVVPTYIDATGHEAVGMCFLLLPEGDEHPQILCEVDQNVVAQVVATLPAWAHEETSVASKTQAAIGPLVQALSAGPDRTSRCLAISPTTDTFTLPWQLLFSRAGWSAPDGGPLPVLIMPTHALTVTSLEGSDYVLTEDINVASRLGIEDSDNMAQYVRFSWRNGRRTGAGAAVVGDPTGDLPSATEEALEVAALLDVEPLLGSAATQSAVLRALEGADLVHLAAHTTVDAERPLQSKLALADGELTGASLVSRLGESRLVVLSACHSGFGESLGGGELASFTTALLRAGIHCVVSSSWPVDDAASSFLMTTFHELRIQGSTIAAALAKAAAAVASEPGWDAPYYWAAFTATQNSYA